MSGSHVSQPQTAFLAAPLPVSAVCFECINIRALYNKFDDISERFCDHHLAVLGLTETWMNVDNPVVVHLHSSGYSVINYPLPWIHDDLSVLRGRAAVVALYSWSLSILPLGLQCNCLILNLTIWWPLAIALLSLFIDLMLNMPQASFLMRRLLLLEQFVQLSIVGDLNVQLDQSNDPCTVLTLLSFQFI